MHDKFDTVIHEVVEEFDSVQTTEDTRSGMDRRSQQSQAFPLKDMTGNVIAKDRRAKQNRRNTEIDIDDISEYVSEIH